MVSPSGGSTRYYVIFHHDHVRCHRLPSVMTKWMTDAAEED
jgi:hypothetical protein